MTAPLAFARPDDFRRWLREHHADRDELFVRCFKTQARRRGMTYPEALDEALCFGWIDGVRHRIDARSFSVRFTPRKAKSIWSAVNLRRASRLKAQGRLLAPGLAALGRRQKGKAPYSFESRPKRLSGSYLKRFRAERRAWSWFQQQPAWYQRTSSFWVMSAKREQTRARRFALLLACSRRGATIPQLRRSVTKHPPSD